MCAYTQVTFCKLELRSIVAGMLLFIGWVGRDRKNSPGALIVCCPPGPPKIAGRAEQLQTLRLTYHA